MGEAYNTTLKILNEYNITANKNLGQNFLIDDEIIDRIIEESEISQNDFVIEIGPGLGILTNKLISKAGKVLAIEIDKKMVNILKNRFGNERNFEILHDDILKINLREILEKEKFASFKVVANLPYYITTPIIMKLLEENYLNLDCITIMVQKEVADRLLAKTGEKNCGAITYAIYYYSEPEKIIDVPSSSFIPMPSVESEVIKLNLRKQPIVLVKKPTLLFEIIKVAFMQRRKTVSNSLMSLGIWNEKQDLINVLESLNISPKSRAEELTLEQFACIANKINSYG